MRRLLGIGECMVELSAAGPSLWRQGFAGDVFNTLWYARALLGERWEVHFHTAIGPDALSDALLAFAEESGIRCDGVARVADRVPGLYAIHLDRGKRSFTYWRDSSAARLLLADRDAVRDAILAADVTYVSGITLAILRPDEADALIAMLAEARALGRLVAFDPNIRPRLWADASGMRSVVLRAAQASSIVLPSFDDEAQAFGDPSPEVTARRYLAEGCDQVVVKDGSRPTLLAMRGTLRVFPVEAQSAVVDTTAAGDSFTAAYLARLMDSDDPAGAVRAAQAVAARVVGAPGALVRLGDLTI